MLEMNRVLNRVRNTPDERDYIYQHIMKLEKPVKPLPKFVDVFGHCPPIWDQLAWGSCTMNAGTRMMGMLTMLTRPWEPLSRSQGYWSERAINGTQLQDSGASIRDCCDVFVDTGVCLEQFDPYDADHIFREPSKEAMEDAAKRKAVAYFALNSEREWKTCLSHGYPFMLGLDVYSSFMDDPIARDGIMRIPKANETNEGGHALLCTGYDSNEDIYLIDNSWGTSWGRLGRFKMPGRIMRDQKYVSDQSTIRLHQGLLLPKPANQAA